MDRRQVIKTLGLSAFLGVFSESGLFAKASDEMNCLSQDIYTNSYPSAQLTAYLMAYFKSDSQQLFYACSKDCRNWTPLNGGRPVLEPPVNLRDPFIGRANGKFHLVHTKGWDYPVIYHYSSSDMLDWHGGPIQIVSDEKKRAWAPEWYYEEAEGIFYVFWASVHNGHNAIFYTKTKDWKDIRPEHAKVYYDLGIDDIDFTVTKVAHGYYAFHKPGSLEDNFNVECLYSPTLNPEDNNFGFGNKEYQAPDLPDVIKPIEGPEIIRLNEGDKWYIYADPFHHSFIAWETSDFKQFKRITISVPEKSKHCSILGISEKELFKLKERFPI